MSQQEQTEVECPACGGDGWVVDLDHAPRCNGMCAEYGCPVQVQAKCPNCDGSGRLHR